jgi:hypothetical protein
MHKILKWNIKLICFLNESLQPQQTTLNKTKILTHDPLDQQTSHDMETGDGDPSEYHLPIVGPHLVLLAVHINFFSAPRATSHHINTAMHGDALMEECLSYNVPVPVQENIG